MCAVWQNVYVLYHLPPTAELSGGMSLREAQLPVQVKCRPSSAICWRRANQRARQLYLCHTIATGIDDQSAKKELKSGSLVQRFVITVTFNLYPIPR
jgi:hypothetical protein